MSDYAASIVIPTYNRASFVKKAIDSALSQTVKCEVVVSDHGSTDETSELMKQYGKSINYIRREKDNGPFFSWLDGVISSNCEFVHITYDDDWIDDIFIEKALNLFTSECAFVFTSASVHEPQNEIINLYENLFPSGIHKVDLIEDVIIESAFAISPGCALFRKEDIIDSLFIGRIPFSKNIYKGVGPDMLMFLSPLLKYPKFGFINEPLAHYRSHDGSITIDSFKDLEKQKKLINAYIDTKKFFLICKLVTKYNLQNLIYLLVRRSNSLKRKLNRFFKMFSI